jgi:hypothetical protein
MLRFPMILVTEIFTPKVVYSEETLVIAFFIGLFFGAAVTIAFFLAAGDGEQ